MVISEENSEKRSKLGAKGERERWASRFWGVRLGGAFPEKASEGSD